jgi:acetyl coenzyme A synthetase (ADP forming)-like protein
MPTRAAAERDVILRDGSTLRLRPPTREDTAALLDFFARLSPESVYQRFHGALRVTSQLVETFVDPDWDELGSLVGTLGDDGRIVALAEYVRLRDPESAEVAFAVADELQGRGIGTRLLEQLAAEAAAHGIKSFVAEVLAGNRPMLRVFEDAGFDVARRRAQGEIELEFRIAATDVYRERVDERDHVAVAASLQPFFAPRTVAVFGASPRRGTIGGELFRNILTGEFAGAAYPINRTGTPVAGVRAYTAAAQIPDEVDLAVICVPAAHVLEAADEALRTGTKAICVISAGFTETGAEGAERQNELLALVRAHGARLIGPNCLGLAVSSARLNATFGPRALPPGNVAFSSQSGALGLALLEQAESRGLGFSAFVSVGNKADVSSNDLLEYWEDDAGTDVILLYLESFGNPRKFGRLARRVARRKPILAMKGGRTRSGAKAAGSHTAALAGSEQAVDALFLQAGVIRAETLEELVDTAGLLASQPLPHGNRVAVLTNAGGLGILCADACEASGLELPTLSEATREALALKLPREASLANPIDMLGSATAATYQSVLPHVISDPEVDAVIVLFVPPVVASAEDVAAAVASAVEGANVTDKPVLAAFVSAGRTPSALIDEPGRVAAFAYPESAARALGRAAERAAWLRRPAGVVPDLAGIDEEAAARVIRSALDGSSDAWLDPARVRALLDAYGIAFVGERVAATADEAVGAADELGYPVAVKTAEAGAHKSDRKLIALDLADEASVRAEVARIGLPVVVQPMIEGGVELLAGVVQDPVFGPLVACGPGGVFAELIGDAQFRLAPLTDVDAAELVTTGKAGRLAAGYRDKPAADAEALADVLLRLSRLAERHPEIAELDLNPVIGLADGCVAVDARVRVRPPEPPAGAKTW